MPIANGFLGVEDFDHERFFDLEVGFCNECTMAQFTNLVDPGELFHESYAFYSSTSVRMANHFQRFAERVRKEYLPDTDPFVVEIGSNDGILLENFARADIRHVGVEPSTNVAEDARSRGINTISGFFDFT